MLRALGSAFRPRLGRLPEGDTVWRSCRRLHAVLAGQRLTKAEFRVPTLAVTDLAGVTVLDVVSRGKHQLFRFDNGYTLHTHFRMEGTWRTFPRGRRWTGGEPFQIRAVLRTATTTRSATGSRWSSCCRPPRRTRWSDISARICSARTGTRDEALRRIRAEPGRSVGEALLDQRNLAGIGTFYRAELLFLQGLHPAHAGVGGARSAPAGAAGSAADDRQPGPGRAVHDRRSAVRGRRTYVFERPGQPCRRCGTRIQTEEFGPPGQERRSYWCPRCQPARAVSAAR